MIDFINGSFIKLKLTDPENGFHMVQPLLIGGEQVMSAYKGMRDFVVFTNMRVIAVNVAVYRARYADLQRAFGGALKSYYLHYIRYGKREGRSGK